MDLKASWIEKGFIDEPIPQGLDLKQDIRQLCEEKNAIILAHYYTIGELQDLADFVGDSLALAILLPDVICYFGMEPAMCTSVSP